MKKFIFTFFILFTLIIAAGCNARRNTIHFEPENEEITMETGNENQEVSIGNQEEESAETGEKTIKTVSSDNYSPPVKLSITSFEGGELNTNVNYHVIRGETPQNTDTIKINDYVLTKYLPGQTQWSYIAATGLNTLKEGTNSYTVKALDKEGELIESKDFSINYTSPEIPGLPYVGTSHWAILILSVLISVGYFGIARKKCKM